MSKNEEFKITFLEKEFQHCNSSKYSKDKTDKSVTI